MSIPYNIIIHGPSGCGKTTLINQVLIPEIISNTEVDAEKYIERVQFSGATTHEDFWRGYRPTMRGGDITFDYVEGPALRILRAASNDPQHKYILVIEDLNRGDAYNVFGPLFQLLDRTEEGKSDYPISFTEIEQDKLVKKELRLPSNLYIVATMSSSKNCPFRLDTAFDRRFHDIYISEDRKVYGAEYLEGENSGFMIANEKRYMDLETFTLYRRQINEKITEESLAEDKIISWKFIDFDDLEKKALNEDGTLNMDAQANPVACLGESLFITNILGYLLENVYRGWEDFAENILQEEARTTIKQRSILGILNYYYRDEETLLVNILKAPTESENH